MSGFNDNLYIALFAHVLPCTSEDSPLPPGSNVFAGCDGGAKPR